MYNILMIAPTPFFADRGCHVRILGEAQALQTMGNQVTICTYHHGRNVPGVKTERTLSIPWYRRLEAGPTNHKYYTDLLLLIKSSRVAMRTKPDIIHAHLHEGAFIGTILKRIFNRPVLLDYQGSLTDELAAHKFINDGSLYFKALGALERWINRSVDAIVTSTTKSEQHLRLAMPEIADKLQVVTDGVDTRIFKPAKDKREIRKRFGLPCNKKIIFFIGVLNEYQGIDILLRCVEPVCREIPDAHFVIAGFPQEKYKQKAQAMGIARNVTFTGKVAFQDTPDLTAAADVAVTPKISQSEGNLKIYNYLACGLPVVAFDTPVNREVLADMGSYAPPGDARRFGEAIVQLLIDARRRAALGLAGRRRAEELFSWQTAAQKLMQVYGWLSTRLSIAPTSVRDAAQASVCEFIDPSLARSGIESLNKKDVKLNLH